MANAACLLAPEVRPRCHLEVIKAARAWFGSTRAIKALTTKPEPWTGARVAGALVTWYEIEVEGYLVGFSVSTNPEDKEPTLKIHYVVEGGS